MEQLLGDFVGIALSDRVFAIIDANDGVKRYIGLCAEYWRVICCQRHGGMFIVQPLLNTDRMMSTFCSCMQPIVPSPHHSFTISSFVSLPQFTTDGHPICEHQLAALLAHELQKEVVS